MFLLLEMVMILTRPGRKALGVGCRLGTRSGLKWIIAEMF